VIPSGAVRSGTTFNDLRLKMWLRGPTTPIPPSTPIVLGVTAAANFQSGIGHEDREICRSPRRERSVSALCSWGDGHHADCEFTLADLVLKPLPQTAKPVGGVVPTAIGCVAKSNRCGPQGTKAGNERC
jgi:hypothetical protein